MSQKTLPLYPCSQNAPAYGYHLPDFYRRYRPGSDHTGGFTPANGRYDAGRLFRAERTVQHHRRPE